VRQYSQTPAIEKAAVQVGRAKRLSEEKRQVLAEENRVRTQEELDREVAALEALQGRPIPKRRKRPKRPSFFLDPLARYRWALEYQLAGGTLDDEDQEFCEQFEAQMSEGEREYWETYKEVGGNG
jgi:hypothetical protein